MGHVEMTIGWEGGSTKAHLWSEAPRSDTGRRRWWALPWGERRAVLVKVTHHMRRGKVAAPYEIVDPADIPGAPVGCEKVST